MKNFFETTICMQVGKIMVGRNYGWNDRCTELSLETLVEGFAVYLGRNKSKDTPLATVLVDMNDRFHFGMVVEYHKQSDDSEGGSWSLSITFNEKDIDYDNWTIVKYPEDPVLSGIIYDVGFTKYGIHFKFAPRDNVGTISEGSPQELFCTIVDVLIDYMRANVAIDPEMELTKFFTVTAKLEGDGSVYLGVEPSALLKQHVKDDSISDD